MSKKFKALVLGLVAVLAISVAGVFSASAGATGHITSEAGHTTLKGEGLESTIFEDAENASAKTICESSTLEATMSSSLATEVSFTPTFLGCKSTSNGGKVDFQNNGCTWLTTPTAAGAKHSIVHIKCPPGNVAHITYTNPFGDCTVTVKEQTAENGVVLDKEGSGKTRDLRATTTLVNVHITYDGGIFACGVPNGTTSKKATLKASFTIKGFDKSGSQVGIEVTGE